MVSEPANNLTPVLLAKEAAKLKNYGIKVNILDEKKLIGIHQIHELRDYFDGSWLMAAAMATNE